jgi:uncharacterized protein (TIGR02145 family)
MCMRYFTSIILLVLLITIANCTKDIEPLPNQPPTCDIVNPTDGQQLTKGESFIIIAEASDNDGSIIEVLFFIDGIEKGSDNNTPFEYIWDTSTESIGPHTIKAISFDNEGGSTSDEISVIIIDGIIGLFLDPRDGQEYKIVEIGDQTWFAENLNYETPNSAWYDNSFGNGTLYGRLYTWDDAISACPTGWHLPSDDEWKTLEMYLGMSLNEANQVGNRGTDEGAKLKSTDGWIPYNGTNSSRFSGLPGGVRVNETLFQYKGEIGYWWTATENTDELAWGRLISGDYDIVWRGYGNKNYGYSVRCIKD